mgnify:CR=1 FL=1
MCVCVWLCGCAFRTEGGRERVCIRMINGSNAIDDRKVGTITNEVDNDKDKEEEKEDNDNKEEEDNNIKEEEEARRAKRRPEGPKEARRASD